jgi:hypothetical protein
MSQGTTDSPKLEPRQRANPDRYQLIAYLKYAMKDVAALNDQSAYLLKMAIQVLELDDLTIVPVDGQ